MTTIQPVAKQTLGQKADADIEWLHTRITALEAKAQADAKSVAAWLKANWPHFVTYAGLGYAFVKHIL